MPMKPAAPDRTAPIGEADGDADAEQIGEEDEQHDADDPDRGVLPPQIGLRAFGDRGCDLLHALGACVALHHIADGPEAIDDRQKTAQG